MKEYKISGLKFSPSLNQQIKTAIEKKIFLLHSKARTPEDLKLSQKEGNMWLNELRNYITLTPTDHEDIDTVHISGKLFTISYEYEDIEEIYHQIDSYL